jgi:hypothetical protein
MMRFIIVVYLVALTYAVEFPPQQERDALHDVYFKCHGPHWPEPHQLNWLNTANVCTWANITCEEGPPGELHVTALDFEYDKMRCELPYSTSNLIFLKTVDISSLLIGTIPDAVRNWTRLNHLLLYENQITGTLPDWLPELTLLTNFSIVATQPCEGLHGTIPDSYKSIKWVHFVIDNNSITGDIPLWVQGIKEWHLRDNKFTGPCNNTPDWMSPNALPIICSTPKPSVPPGSPNPSNGTAHVPRPSSSPRSSTPTDIPPVEVKQPVGDVVVKVLFVFLAVCVVVGSVYYVIRRRRQRGYADKFTVHYLPSHINNHEELIH